MSRTQGVTAMAIQVSGSAAAVVVPHRDGAAPPPLHVEIQRARTTVLLLLCGELDMATAPLLVDVVDAVLEEPCETLIVSCEDLTFVDSTGLRALLAVRAACAGGDTRVYLVKRGRQLQRQVELTGLTSLFR